MKKWLKFFGLSFFSDKIAGEAPRHGYRNLLLALVLAFLFFFAGFLSADVVPFSCHYKKAGKFGQFVDAAFSKDDMRHGIALTVEKGCLKAAFGKQTPSEEKIANTYTDQSAAAEYAVNGYQLIVDTRPATTPVVFTQVGVSSDGEKISYEQYRSLSETEKQKYTLNTEYTDEEMVLTDEKTSLFEDFLKNDEQATEKYGVLQEEKSGLTEEGYRKRLYALYVRYYYRNVTSVLASAEVPVLRDYYYANYILKYKTDYLYIFSDIVYGSFATDAGVRVNFGGFTSTLQDGAVGDAGELIKAVFYGGTGYALTSYFLNTMMQLPLLAVVLLLIALLVWAAGKLSKCVSVGTFGECVKTVGSFLWFSAFLTGLVAFAFGFLIGGAKAYSLMLPVFSLVLLVRSAVNAVPKIIKEKKNKEIKAPSDFRE